MLQSRCQRKVNGTVVVWVWRVTENLVLKSLRKFYSDGWDLREHPQRRARQAIASGNFNSEKIISEWAQHGDPKFEAKKFIKKAMQEVAEKLKNWSGAAVKRKLLKKTSKIGSNFLRSMIRNHEQWESILLRSWLTEQLWRTYVPHQALITSSSIGKPSREIGMPRNTCDNMSILGNVFDCQQARRDREELHNDSRNLTTPSGIDDDVEDSEKRRNWEQWERRAIAINTCYLAFQKERGEKVLTTK